MQVDKTMTKLQLLLLDIHPAFNQRQIKKLNPFINFAY